MKVTRLHLIRHGAPEGSGTGLYMGSRTDKPLSKEGAQALRALQEKFAYPRVNTVFSSPMQRAVQTADILFADAQDKLVLPQLREIDLGEFDGCMAEDLLQNEHFNQWMNPESRYTPEGGESSEDFHMRCAATLMEILQYMMKNNIDEAACVTHGGVIASMMTQCALPLRAPAMWQADPGCGYTVLCTPAMWMRDGAVEARAIVPAGYLDDADDGDEHGADDESSEE